MIILFLSLLNVVMGVHGVVTRGNRWVNALNWFAAGWCGAYVLVIYLPTGNLP